MWKLIPLVAFGAFVGLEVVSRAPTDALSAGPLAEVHAALDGECGRCHEPGRKVVARLCLACHGRVAADGDPHADALAQTPCDSCHHEHLGRKARLIRRGF
jgi:hypothetical protein